MMKSIHIDIDRDEKDPGYQIIHNPGRLTIMIQAVAEAQAALYYRAALAEIKSEDAETVTKKTPGRVYGRLELVK